MEKLPYLGPFRKLRGALGAGIILNFSLLILKVECLPQHLSKEYAWYNHFIGPKVPPYYCHTPMNTT